mgnify:CR=1 FL=1
MKQMKKNKPMGRPPIKVKDRRVTLAVRVHPDTRKHIQRLAKKQKISMGSVIDLLCTK